MYVYTLHVNLYVYKTVNMFVYIHINKWQHLQKQAHTMRFFFFGRTRAWTQVLCLLGRHSTTLATPQPFLLWLFLELESLFFCFICHGPWSLFYASAVAGMADAHHWVQVMSCFYSTKLHLTLYLLCLVRVGTQNSYCSKLT
jgi:hypothetical protein